jgi:hypothetical protein
MFKCARQHLLKYEFLGGAVIHKILVPFGFLDLCGAKEITRGKR